MIKEIFLPEKIGDRRFISKRIIGIATQEERLCATQIYATSSATIIEKIYEQEIPTGAPGTEDERLAGAIKKLVAQFPKHHEMKIALPSKMILFKELTLPFIDLDKIRMVLEYEIEPLLPFSMEEAIVDFIVTAQDKKSSHLLVAAIRKEQLQHTFALYEKAGIDPTTITVDLFALYGLYMQIPDYQALKNASAIIDVGATNTSVAFLLDGKMRLIRNLSRGISTVAEHMSTDLEQDPEKVLRDLVSHGIEKPDAPRYTQAAKKHFTTFLNDIQFTLNSFSLTLNFYDDIQKILFSGQGSDIKGLMGLGSDLLQIPCEKFSCEKLFRKKTIKDKTKRLTHNWAYYATCLGTAMSYPPP